MNNHQFLGTFADKTFVYEGSSRFSHIPVVFLHCSSDNTPASRGLGDRALILLGAAARVATRVLLLYGTSLWQMQLMQAPAAFEYPEGIWRFPKIGVPPNHLCSLFFSISHPFW